jgi:hypothetical protein
MIDLSIAAADRLRTLAGAQFALVGNVADFEALADMPRSVPAAYLLPLGERAEPSTTLTRNTQRHRCTIGVVLVVRHAGDASGSRSASALQALRLAVQSALLNWTPATDCGALQFAEGQLVEFVDGTTIWRDDFEVERWVRHD